MEKYTCWSFTGSFFGTSSIFNYINDLPSGIESIRKIFEGNTSLFSKVKGETFSNTQLNNNLNKIGKCAFQWKLLFNLDPNKQAMYKFFS